MNHDRMKHRSVLRGFCLSSFAATIRLTVATCALTFVLAGCAHQKATVSDLQYCDDISGVQHYRGHASNIAYPCLDNQTDPAVASSLAPRNLLNRTEDQPLEFSLAEAINTALTQNKVIETSALGGVGSKGVLTNPATVMSVYDPAIQASGVLFGRRSVEAALADFDTTFRAGVNYSRSDIGLQSGALNGGGNRTAFASSLSKQLVTGGSLTLNNDWTHSVDPVTGTGTAATPNYFGRLGAEIRQPLLAGSGADFTRIAGPANPNFGAITGVTQGVVIARINQDISIADFEVSVRNALRDIEDAYWDLYLAYRTYDTAVVAHQSAFQTWRESQDRLEVGVLKPADELQARDRLYETKAQVETNLNGLYRAESELRRLIGLPVNDGRVLRPVDEPAMAEFVPDWEACLTEALTHRVELRRQKWNIKSLQLQLLAAESLVRPRLDFTAGYDINGAGDRFLSQSGNPFSSAVGSMTNQDIDSWNAGLQLSIPLGLRFARSQVRNIELQIAKANAVLASQEKNIAHDIATAIQDVTSAYTAAQSNHKRLNAAAKRVSLLEAEREVGTLTLDLVLRAQSSLAAAENSYYQQMVSYNKAITSLHLAKGTLLDNDGVLLAEGRWCPDAYCDADLRAHARTHAKDAPRLRSAPSEFVSYGPTGTVNLDHKSQQPTTNGHLPMNDLPAELVPAPEDAVPAPTDSADNAMAAPFPPPNLRMLPLNNYELDPPRSASADSKWPGFEKSRN